MKKFITIILLLFAFVTNSQTQNNSQISTREEVITAPMLVCSNEERSKWFAILPTFEKFNGLTIKTYVKTLKLNIGKCSKNDVLVFTFIGGKKIKIFANNEMNCDLTETNEFLLNSIDIAFLETRKLESIRYINGNDQSSYLYTLTEKDKDYFINTFSSYKK